MRRSLTAVPVALQERSGRTWQASDGPRALSVIGVFFRAIPTSRFRILGWQVKARFGSYVAHNLRAGLASGLVGSVQSRSGVRPARMSTDARRAT